MFLQILSELVDKTQYSKYVIWDEEPGVYIVFIDKIDDLYDIKIAFSEFCHDELFADIINVIGDVSYDEMKSKLNDIKLICDGTWQPRTSRIVCHLVPAKTNRLCIRKLFKLLRNFVKFPRL